MRFALLLSVIVLLQCIAPSHQYGTMFTDNITPAFMDQTFFSGIRTFEAYSTDASVGKDFASNVYFS